VLYREGRPVFLTSSRAFVLSYLEMPAAPSPCPCVGHGAQSVLGVNQRRDLVVSLACEALYASPRVDDATVNGGESSADRIGGRERGDAEEITVPHSRILPPHSLPKDT